MTIYDRDYNNFENIVKKYRVFNEMDNSFQRKVRLLQSIFREDVLKISRCGMAKNGREYGNYLHKDDKGKNFLTDRILKIVESELTQKGDRLIEEDRLHYNMLSSQPLCFNLFGEMVDRPELCRSVFQEIFGDNIRAVKNIQFEYSRGRKDDNFTGDRSACDVFIEYLGPNGNSFIGVEVKYHENMKEGQKAEDESFEKHEDNYRRINKSLGCFNEDDIEKLRRLPLAQIWRDHLLCHSFFDPKNPNTKIYDDYIFMFLYPNENINCKEAIEDYERLIKRDISSSHIKAVSLEDFFSAINKHCKEEWVCKLGQRYLGISP